MGDSDSLRGLVHSQTGSDSQHARVPFASLAHGLGDIRFGLVHVPEQEVSSGVRSEYGRCTSSGQLVQLLVKVVRLV